MNILKVIMISTCDYISTQTFVILGVSNFFCFLFLERGGGKEKERERNIDVINIDVINIDW